MEQRNEDDARRKEGSELEQRECERMGWQRKRVDSSREAGSGKV